MVQLKMFDQTDYIHYPYVENLCGEIVPRLARVQMTVSGEDLFAILVVDGSGIQVTIFNAAGEQQMVFCRELYPFPLAVFVAEHLEEPLSPEVLIRLGFERFK